MPVTSGPTKAFVPLSRVESSAAFKELSMEDQVKVRASWAKDNLPLMDSFNALDEQGKLNAAQYAINHGPVFKDESDPTVAWAKDVSMRALNGDPSAKEEIKSRLMLTESTRSSIVGNIVAGVASVWDENNYAMTYGKEGRKINSMISSALNASPTLTAQEMADFEGALAATSFAVNFVEAAITSATLVGSVGKAGLLTKGLMGPTGRIAKLASTMKHGFAQGLVAELGEQAAQSVIFGTFSVAQNSALMLLQDPSKKLSMKELGSALGQEVMFDWVAWAAFSPAITAAKAIHMSMAGFGKERKAAMEAFTKLSPEQQIDYTLKVATGAVDDPAMKEAFNKYAPELMKTVRSQQNHLAGMLAEKDISPVSRAKLASHAAGFQLDVDGAKYKLTPYDAPENPRTFADLDEAVRYSVSHATTGVDDIGIGPATSNYMRSTAKVQWPENFFSPEEARRVISPIAGNIAPSNAQFFVRNVLKSAGSSEPVIKFFDKVKFIQDTEAFAKANPKADVLAKEFKLPSSLNDPASEVNVRNYLFNYAREIAKIDQNPKVLAGVEHRISQYLENLDKRRVFDTGSLESLNYVLKNSLGSEYVLKNGKIHIDGIGYETVEAAFANTWEKLFKAGKLDLETSKEMIESFSGFKLDIEEGLVPGVGKVNKYVLRHRDGTIRESDTDIGRLIAKVPEISNSGQLKLPGALSPHTYVVDARKNILKIQTGVAAGSLENLLDLSGHFFTPKRGYKVVSMLDDQPISLKTVSQKYEIYNRENGFFKEFNSKIAAVKYLTKNKDSWQQAVDSFADRGYTVTRGPRGELEAWGLSGEQHSFKTKAEANEFLKSHPLPENAGELIDGVPPEQYEGIEKIAIEASQEVSKVGPIRKALQGVLRSRTLSMAFLPTESHFEDVLLKSGNPGPLRAWRKFGSAVRYVNARSQQLKPIIESIWNNVSTKDYPTISQMLEFPEADWGKLLEGKKNALELTNKVKQIKDYYNSMYKAFNMSEAKMLTEYAPRIRSYIASIRAKGQEPHTNTTEFLKDIFGPTLPKELEFFAEHTRRDVFLDTMMETDPFIQMTAWTNNLLKKSYISPVMPQMQDAYKETMALAKEGKIDEASAAFLRDSMLEAFGAKTALGKRMQETSARLTTKLYEKVFKGVADSSPFMRDWHIDRLLVTDDIIGKMGSWFTINTQAARIWAIPRNLTQVSLLGAITGNRAAWDSFSYVVRHPEYVDTLMKRGLFSETMTSQGTQNIHPFKSLLEKSLSPLENSDVITRATAVHTADTMYDKALERLGKITTPAQFLEEISGDLLDTDLQTQLVTLALAGQHGAAKDLLGRRFMDLTMFNYNKGQQGTAFRGVAGRLFGKLGVYPMGALSLYRDILTRGSPAKIAARAARLVSTTLGIYWMFNEVGMDYKGFLWNDPFEFNGGPYWSMLMDFGTAIGSGSDAPMAREKLKRSLSRLAVPSVFRYWYDAVKYASEGETYKAILSAMTAPIAKVPPEDRTLTFTGYQDD